MRELDRCLDAETPRVLVGEDECVARIAGKHGDLRSEDYGVSVRRKPTRTA